MSKKHFLLQILILLGKNKLPFQGEKIKIVTNIIGRCPMLNYLCLSCKNKIRILKCA
jgi:hypothetical protein